MATGQLWLFPPPKPLVEQLGEDFFRAVPSGPGVYFMCGASEGVLYVGKARNLRKRLSRLTRSHPLARPSRAFTFGRIPFAVSQTAQVRVANPERLPRRIIRLLHRVTRIEWDECPSEEAARARERDSCHATVPSATFSAMTSPEG